MNNTGLLPGIQNTAFGIFGCSREPQMKETPKEPAPSLRPAAPEPVQAIEFRDDNWERADWPNKGVFNCVWRPGNISTEDGVMTLHLKRTEEEEYPYVSGEYRSREEFKYGKFHVRMKAASGAGLVSSFFVYTGRHGVNSHHEIDVEILGSNTRQAQLTYYIEGSVGIKKVVDLPFDASEDFHEYGFVWTKTHIEWFVDGNSVLKTEGGRMPYMPCKIMMNLWPGTKEASGWLGGLYEGDGATAQYEQVKYEKAE